MLRTNIYLTNRQLRKLRKLADKTELKVSEIVRRAIDEYLEDKKQRYLLEED